MLFTSIHHSARGSCISYLSIGERTCILLKALHLDLLDNQVPPNLMACLTMFLL
jgi:hypothetical protein